MSADSSTRQFARVLAELAAMDGPANPAANIGRAMADVDAALRSSRDGKTGSARRRGRMQLHMTPPAGT